MPFARYTSPHETGGMKQAAWKQDVPLARSLCLRIGQWKASQTPASAGVCCFQLTHCCGFGRMRQRCRTAAEACNRLGDTMLKTWVGWAGVAIMCITPIAHAAKTKDQPLQQEREYHHYFINADGTYAETVETAVKVLKDTAIEYVKETSISYSTSIQKADVIFAYTLKPDGRRIDVPPGNYQISTNRGREGDSPIYSDLTRLTLIFPDLAVGDTTVFSYRLTASQPMFDGHFSVVESFDPTRYYGDVKIVIDAPETLVARQQAWQLREVRTTREHGRRVVEWAWQNREPADPDTARDSTYDVERYPGYAFSTFTDYAQISRAYGVKAIAKAAVTPRIQRLADDTAGDAAQPREVAKRLYEWVSKHISYAGNCIGLGAVVPRDLDVVLNNKMGDCKDHATLLQALLKAKGIDSTQALINAGDSSKLPKIPVASMVNHVINYIPAMDLFLDSTAGTEPFGSLPASVSDKPVLLVDGYRDGMKTPALKRSEDWQRMTTQLQIGVDGSVKGTLELELKGRLAIAVREQFKAIDDDTKKDLVKSYFAAKGVRGTGIVRIEDPQPAGEHLMLKAEFDARELVTVPGGFAVSPWFISLAPITALVGRGRSDPDHPAAGGACSGVRSEEEYRYEFAKPIEIAVIPRDFEAHNEQVNYSASYRREDNRIIIRRTLDDRTPGPTCSSEYNAGYSGLMDKIMPNLRAQIIYLLPTANSR